MKTITLKNVPASVHRAIKRRAEKNRRSINGEIISCLEKILGLSTDESKELVKRIERVQSGMNFKITRDEIQQAKIEGRE